MEPELVEAYETLKEQTFDTMRTLANRTVLFARPAHALKVAVDRNELKEVLTLFYYITAIRDDLAMIEKKLSKFAERMSSDTLPKGFKNCGIEKEYIGDVTFSVVTPRQGRRAGKPRVEAD
jgi:hypothetical protein